VRAVARACAASRARSCRPSPSDEGRHIPIKIEAYERGSDAIFPLSFLVPEGILRASATRLSDRFALVSRRRLGSVRGGKAASRSMERLPLFCFSPRKLRRPVSWQVRKGSMPLTVPDRRTVLRHALYWTAAFLVPGSPAIASEITASIEQLHTGLIEIMKAGKRTPFRQRYDKIAPVIARTFDLEVIVRQVVGPRWAALPPDQQGALGDAFRRYTVASYVSNFDEYSGERFEVLPGVAAFGNDRVVRTQIVTTSGQAHVLAYVIRQTADGWRIVDVLADGSVSRVAAQRSEIRSVLSDGGGTGLLVSLRRKTAELSGGILQ
jgi:phospholipid transport system substrate-binding protein